MLTPGTSTWLDAVVPSLIALLLLVVPGLGAGLLLGARPATSLGVAPAVSTTVLVVGASLNAALRASWSVWALLLTVSAAWGVAFAVRQLLSRLVPRRPATPDGRRPHGSVVAKGVGAPRVAQVLGTVAGVCIAAVVVVWVYMHSASSPELFPQHPDTIFHVGVTQWMAEHRDASFQHGTDFVGVSPNRSYPVGFHVVTSTVSIITGQPAVVAVTATVVALAAVLWPLAMGVLARHLFGATPAAAAAGAAASVLFIGFPFMLMAFGVLWPNLFGQVLLPGVLALVVVLARRVSPGVDSDDRTSPTVVLLLLAAPGLAVAHPNALITAVVFSALTLWVAAIRRSWFADGYGVRRWWPAAGATAVVVGGIAFTTVGRLSMMFLTGTPGPEMTLKQALVDVLGFAPRTAAPVYLLAALVAIGALVVLRRFPHAAWLLAAMALMVSLYVANTAVDTPLARLWTWPWYNNAIRIAAVGVFPAALLTAAAFLGMGRLARRWVSPPWRAEAVGVTVVLILLLLSTRGFVSRDVSWVRPYFNPGVSRSWASPAELRALHELAGSIPEDGLVVADPWKGGTYLYVVGDRRLYYPTEKYNNTPDRRLVGLRLGDVARDPEVCRIVREAGITHALVGGVPFLWGRARSERQYVGVEAVQSSPGWERVTSSGPYSLYRLKACAS